MYQFCSQFKKLLLPEVDRIIDGRSQLKECNLSTNHRKGYVEVTVRRGFHTISQRYNPDDFQGAPRAKKFRSWIEYCAREIGMNIV